MATTNRTFVEQCVGGDAVPADIDNFIACWHKSEITCSIYEFLGMTWAEYAQWVANPNCLDKIIMTHKGDHMKVEETRKAVMSADEVKDAIKHWMLNNGWETKTITLTTAQEDHDGPGYARHICDGATMDVVPFDGDPPLKKARL